MTLIPVEQWLEDFNRDRIGHARDDFPPRCPEQGSRDVDASGTTGATNSFGLTGPPTSKGAAVSPCRTPPTVHEAQTGEEGRKKPRARHGSTEANHSVGGHVERTDCGGIPETTVQRAPGAPRVGNAKKTHFRNSPGPEKSTA